MPMIVLNIISSTEITSITLRAIVLLLITYRSYKKRSLTNSGIAAALVTGLIHSLPPSNIYLILLCTFYVTSSQATKFKEDIKEKKTKSPTLGVASQRTHVQVLCNSIVASLLILVSIPITDPEIQLLVKAGIIGQYVAVQADTWSSELGILSSSSPFLITTFQKVPPGTNGGVTKEGLLSGLVGSALLSVLAAFTYSNNPIGHFIYFTLIGFLGTIVDSVLGAIFQYSIVDDRGLILEAAGGEKIDKQYLFDHRESLKRVSGEDIFSNNQVNVIMAGLTTMLSIGLYQLFF